MFPNIYYSRLVVDPSNFIARCQLTEFGFTAILNDSQIVVCPIDEFVCGDLKRTALISR